MLLWCVWMPAESSMATVRDAGSLGNVMELGFVVCIMGWTAN